MTTVSTLPGRKRANRRDAPYTVFKKISALFVRRLIAPRKILLRTEGRRKRRGLLPFSFSRQTLARPLRVSRRLEEADVRNGLIKFVRDAMKSSKITNHPFTVALFPVQR